MAPAKFHSHKKPKLLKTQLNVFKKVRMTGNQAFPDILDGNGLAYLYEVNHLLIYYCRFFKHLNKNECN